MNEAWQLVEFIAAPGCAGWLIHAVAARVALKKLQKVAGHRLNLEQCWLLVSQVPDTLLPADTRKALGKILTHHLARSRRSGTNESAQDLLTVREHMRAHDPLYHTLLDVEQALAQRKA